MFLKLCTLLVWCSIQSCNFVGVTRAGTLITIYSMTVLGVFISNAAMIYWVVSVVDIHVLMYYLAVSNCWCLSVVIWVLSRHGHIKAVTMLLNEFSCSPNVTDDSGSTPLHLAAQHGRVYVVELLLTHQELDVVSWLYLCSTSFVFLLFSEVACWWFIFVFFCFYCAMQLC